MTVKAELQFVTDAERVAAAAADNVARFRSELEKLQGLSGKINFGGGGPSGLPSNPGWKVGSDGRLRDAKGRFVSAEAQAQAAIGVGFGAQGEQYTHAEKLAQIQAQSDAEHANSMRRIAEQYQKDRNAILVSGANASHALQADELSHQHKIAEIEKKGALDAQRLRVKGEEDRARIAAKAMADEARDARKVALRKTEGGSSKLGDAIKSLVTGGGIQGAASEMGGRAQVIVALGAAAVGAAAKVASLSAEFGEAVVKAQAYREDIAEAFKTVRKTETAANSTMQTALRNADRLGIARAESVGQFLDLATKGFDDSKIKEIQGRLYDITTIDPRASIEGLTKIIGQIQATGRINQETLSMLATAGLEQADVITEIGKIIKKDDKEVLRLLSSAGGIRGLGVDPILSAIANQTGNRAAGVVAAEKSARNMSSLLRRIGEIPENILFDVNAGAGLDSIKDTLRQIIAYFDVGSKTGERVRKVVGDLFNALSEGLFKKRSGDERGVVGTLDNIVGIAERSIPIVRTAAETVGSLARAMLAIGSGDTSKLDESTKRIVGVINLVKEIGLLMAPGAIGGTFGPGGLIQPILDIIGVDYDASEIRKWVDGVAGLLNPMNIIRTIKAGMTGGDTTLGNPILQAIQSAIDGAVTSAVSGATSLGGDIVDGLVNGIKAKLASIGSVATSMGSTVISSVRAALDSHSPARELVKVGLDAGTGLAIGGARSIPLVESSFSSMASAGLLAAATEPPLPMAMPYSMMQGTGYGLGAAGTMSPINFTISPQIFLQVAPNADANDIGAAVAEQIRRMTPELITAFFEKFGGVR